MNRKSFYREIVRRGVYVTFNELRTALFGALATDSHIPISYNRLDELLDECKNMPAPIRSFIKTHIDEGDRYRYHYCEAGDICVHYFVDVTRTLGWDEDAAYHFQCWDYANTMPVNAVSVIVLYENHPMIQPNTYPKIIKHELTHAAIEFVMANNLELSSYYFGESSSCYAEETTSATHAIALNFIEFICDLIPYVSTPSKKENGINKFISESEECFGYDAEEGTPAEFVRVVVETMGDDSEESVVIEEPSYEEFKTLKNKYIFILTKTEAKNRMDLLGVRKEFYYNRQFADMWYYTICDILGNEDDATEAREKLDYIHKRMIEE